MTALSRVLNPVLCVVFGALALAPSALGAGTWAPTASLATPRYGAAAQLLQNGRVLVAGGTAGSDFVPTTSAELYDPAAHTWIATGSMGTKRMLPSMTRLLDGKVLVVGGLDGSGGGDVQSAELYDPATGTWSPTGSPVSGHQTVQTVLLADGKVLLAGAPSELYDPATGTWSATGPLLDAHTRAGLARLPDGRVLIAGGAAGVGFTASAEIYDPATGAWSPTGSMGTARMAQMTLLNTGKVLVAGGVNASGSLASAELYDPATGQWTPTGSLAEAQAPDALTLLKDGTVLVAGGGGSGSQVTANAELYNPASGTWTPTASLREARYQATVTRLSDGDVLVAGGLASTSPPFPSAQTSELYSFADEMTLSLAAPAAGTLGSEVSSSSLVATVAAGFAPTGTIRFDVFGPQPDPPTSCAPGAAAPGTAVTSLGNATVSGVGGYSPPAGFAPQSPGHYWWYASYSGDGNNVPRKTACGEGMPGTVVTAAVAEPAKPAALVPLLPLAPLAKPVLKGLKIAPKAFATVARRGKKRKLGAQITYKNSTAATATLIVLRKGKKVGTLKHADVAGVNKVAFSGKFKRKALAPGRYVLTVSAKNSAGASKVVRAKFSIRK